MPSIGQAVARAWRDVFAAFAALWRLALIAFLITRAVGIGRGLLARSIGFSRDWLGAPGLVGMLQAFLLAPYLIAVHRFIILREVSTRYALRPTELRFQLFFGWSVVLLAVWIIPA